MRALTNHSTFLLKNLERHRTGRTPETDLILLIIRTKTSIAGAILNEIIEDTELLYSSILKLCSCFPRQTSSTDIHRMTSRADEIASALGVSHIGSEHLLLALLSNADAELTKAFEAIGIPTSRVTREIETMIAAGK